SRRPTCGWPREAPPRLAPAAGDPGARARDLADLVARARLARRPRRVHRRALALGRGGDRTEPAFGRRALARLEHRDPAGRTAAPTALPARLRRVLGRA